MLYDPEKIARHIERHALKYWRIYLVPGNPKYVPAAETVTKSTNRVDVYKGSEDATPATVATQFKEASEYLPDGKYLVHLSDGEKNTTGGFFLFMQVGDAGQTPASQGIGNPANTEEMLRKYIGAEMEKLRMEMAAERQKMEQERKEQDLRDQIKALADENKELRGIEGPINMIGQAFAQHVSKMLPGMMGGKAPIGNHYAEEAPESPEDLDAVQAQTAAALDTLANKVGDQKLSEALSKLANHDPDTLNNLLSML